MAKKAKEMATKGPQVAQDSVPAAPTAEESQSAIDALVGEIRAAMERARARLPEGLRENAFLVETVLNSELDKVSFAGWRTVAFTEFFALLNTGKSEAPHDPTELA